MKIETVKVAKFKDVQQPASNIPLRRQRLWVGTASVNTERQNQQNPHLVSGARTKIEGRNFSFARGLTE